MSLNIKSDEAHRLTHELAELTGESLTTAVIVAVRERLERIRREPGRVRARAEGLLAIGRDTASRLPARAREVDHGELLYDEHGLPR
jgi:antitoxin VapB